MEENKPVDVNKLKAIRNKIRKENEQKYLENSKDRLEKIVTTKIRTSFIGALSQFEENFGFLWGHGKNGALTEEEVIMQEVWERTRTAVLNNGNNQIRAVKNEIECNTVHWDRYTMEIPTLDSKEGEEENG